MHFFEGVEKRIIVNFSVDPAKPEGLRQLSTDAWKAWCRHARCSILSRTSNDFFDAYVLSESSLFVYPNHIIAKTCGSTTLLHAVEPLLELAASVGCEPEGMCFTRMNYNFPEGQVFPHTSFEEEVEFLDETFVGKPYILGPLDAERYHLYLADSAEDGSDKKTLEVQMFELDPECMKHFFRGPDGLDGEAQTRLSGVDTILPGSTIDAFAFDPCGYSMNGLLDGTYWTIHITPEDHCSYVSFETNLELTDYTELLDRVMGIFKPKRVCVSLLARKDALKGKPIPGVAITGFSRQHGSSSQAANAHELTYAAFTREDAAVSAAAADRSPATSASGCSIARSSSQSVLRKASPAMPAAKNRVSGRQNSSQTLLGASLSKETATALAAANLNALVSSSASLSHKGSSHKSAGSASVSDGRVSPQSEHSGDNSLSALTIPWSPSSKLASMQETSDAAVLNIIRDNMTGAADAFFVVDLGKITAQYLRWQKELPMVAPHYAVKCNPDPVVVKHLKNLGASFDCASEAEIALVLSLGVSPSRIVYANPCRPVAHLRFAKAHSVDLLTADNLDELRKIAAEYPTSRVLIRISPVEADAICALGAKFGATERGVTAMLELAKELRIDIAGVAFHVGSGARSLTSYTATLLRAKAVFAEALEAGFRPRILDIGGGMPGKDCVDSPLAFGDIASTVRPLLKQLFDLTTVKVIAEPGRYFVADSHTLATRIIARRDCSQEIEVELAERLALAGGDHDSETDSITSAANLARSSQQAAKFLYYVADGVYGSFNNIMYDHATVVPTPLRKDGSLVSAAEGASCVTSTIFGPTCDALDVICERAELPLLETGDWIFWRTMGAYTILCCGSDQGFNGMPKPLTYYTITNFEEK